MARGDHIKVKRPGYSHHGIDLGDGNVVHYTGEVWQKRNASVATTSLTEFAKGGAVEVVPYGICDEPSLVIKRAKERLGESQYRLVFNNCEHFAHWCKTGNADSEQVRDATSSAGGVAASGVAIAAGVGVVGATGTVAGLSGAGIMSGLATVGGVVGGGAVAGLGVLASGPAAVTSFAMRSVLKDDPSLPAHERVARKAGRIGTYAGAAGGTAAAIGTVSAAGVAGGLSAAGITSGLAAIGGAVGGGMVAGTAIVVGGPAVAAAGVGYAVYRFFKWRKK